MHLDRTFAAVYYLRESSAHSNGRVAAKIAILIRDGAKLKISPSIENAVRPFDLGHEEVLPAIGSGSVFQTVKNGHE